MEDLKYCKTCLFMEDVPRILPKHPKFYTGSINENYNNYYLKIYIKSILIFKESCKTYEEAFKKLKQKNIELDLPIRNIIYDFGDYYEICLNKDKHTKIDKEDLNKISNDIFYTKETKSDNLFYAIRNSKNKVIKELHRLLANNNNNSNLVVDHINGNGLDNRKSNLRLVTRSVNQMNKISKLNTSNSVGISFDEKNHRYEASFRYNKIRYRKMFNVFKYGNAKESAIEWLNRTKLKVIPEHDRVKRNLMPLN